MRYRQQQGLALITVLLAFAIVSVLATRMIDRQANDVQRSANMFTLQQARAYSYAAEQAVRVGLYLDWDNDAEKDHAQEEWARPRTFPLNPGKVYLTLKDAQGRFNINSMQPTAANKTLQLQRFRNLLNQLGLDVQLAAEVARWLDKDSQVDDVYEGKQPPYRAAYQACKHVSELLLIDGLDNSSYQKLLPYISCLPMETQLNVNTASAMVLASLDAGLSLQNGESLVAARGKDGFASVDDFWNQSLLKRYTQPPATTSSADTDNKTANAETQWQKGDFSINSEYFEMFARVDLNERYATSEALIKRDKSDGRMTVLYRDYSRREEKPKPQTISTRPTDASLSSAY